MKSAAEAGQTTKSALAAQPYVKQDQLEASPHACFGPQIKHLPTGLSTPANLVRFQ
jgi:hypothetical protein